MRSYASLLLPLLTAAPSVHAWGTLGHDTVAYIAQEYVSKKTEQWARSLLNDTSDSYLANVATWADSYRYTAEGTFSAAYHYIDAEDSPPHYCGVDYERDCGDEGCVVSAIANYTGRLTDPKISMVEKNKALKWVIHFLGDIHQPLHDEAINVGGNTINVTYLGAKTNLHHIWDSNIAEQLIGGYNFTYARKWADDLIHEIQKGAYHSVRSEWLTGGDCLSNPIDSAMIWARDANSYVCTAVLPEGVAGVEGHELAGGANSTGDYYYERAVPVIEIQLAKAGYRLAAWLNLIATGKPSLTVAKHVKSEKDNGHQGGKRELVEARSYEGGNLLPKRSLEARKSAARLAREAFGHKC